MPGSFIARAAYRPVLIATIVSFSLAASPNTGCGSFDNILVKDQATALKCEACEALLCSLREKGTDFMRTKFKEICEKNSEQLHPDDCMAHVDELEDDAALFISKLNASDKDACKYFFKCGKPDNAIYDWKLKLNESVYAVTSSPNLDPFDVLHLTDTHVSTEYAYGSAVESNRELSCVGERLVNASGWQAGVYGDMRASSQCDIPMRTLKSLLADAKNRKPQYVYLTGDFIPHTMINYTWERIIKEIDDQSKMIAESFPDAKIIPVIGNHDLKPLPLATHEMVPSNQSLYKIYDDYWKIWGNKWIPASEEKTFKKGGYYTVQPQTGLRVLSLNTEFCYLSNYWLLVDPRDPEGQLMWLSEQLELAIKNSEVVHIVGHVPPGTTECYREWARAYQSVVSRFRNVITGQFFGHMHYDMFTLDMNANGSEVTGVQFVGPSATTFDTGFPSYRMIQFNKHAELMEINTYHLNLTKVNEDFRINMANRSLPELHQEVKKLDGMDGTQVEWDLAYSMKERYGMKDLTTKDFQELFERMKTDDETLAKYFRAYYQFHDDVSDIKCKAGKCLETFGPVKGKDHDVICEIYSHGSSKRDECLKTEDDPKSQKGSAGGSSFVTPSLILVFFCSLLLAQIL